LQSFANRLPRPAAKPSKQKADSEKEHSEAEERQAHLDPTMQSLTGIGSADGERQTEDDGTEAEANASEADERGGKQGTHRFSLGDART
jgi:hypothetical protein